MIMRIKILKIKINFYKGYLLTNNKINKTKIVNYLKIMIDRIIKNKSYKIVLLQVFKILNINKILAERILIIPQNISKKAII